MHMNDYGYTPTPAKSGVAKGFVPDWYRFAVFCNFATIFMRELRGGTEILSLGFATLNMDEIAFLVSVPVALRLRGLRIYGGAPLFLVYIFCATIILSFARGMMTAPKAALFDLRFDLVFLSFFFLTVYGMAVGVFAYIATSLRRWALVFIVLAVLRLQFGYEFLANLSIAGPFFNDGRILGAKGALLISCAAILALSELSDSRSRNKAAVFLLFTAFLGVLAFSGQRTAILAGVAAVVVGGLMASRVKYFFAILAAILLLSFAAGAFDSLAIVAFDRLDNSGSTIGGRSGTFATRLLIWEGFLSSYNTWSAFDRLFGLPMGSRPLIYVDDLMWEASLHSAYLGPMMAKGLLGTIALSGSLVLALIYALLTRQSLSKSGSTQIDLRVVFSFATLLIVFGISYEWREICGMMFGVICTFRAKQRIFHL